VQELGRRWGAKGGGGPIVTCKKKENGSSLYLIRPCVGDGRNECMGPSESHNKTGGTKNTWRRLWLVGMWVVLAKDGEGGSVGCFWMYRKGKKGGRSGGSMTGRAVHSSRDW